MTAPAPISISSAFEFTFTYCGPELLQACAIFKNDIAWQGFAQDLILSRDVLPYAFGATALSALGYRLAKKFDSSIGKTLAGTALTVSAVALGFSGFTLLNSIWNFQGWNQKYPKFTIDNLLFSAKMLEGRRCEL